MNKSQIKPSDRSIPISGGQRGRFIVSVATHLGLYRSYARRGASLLGPARWGRCCHDVGEKGDCVVQKGKRREKMRERERETSVKELKRIEIKFQV